MIHIYRLTHSDTLCTDTQVKPYTYSAQTHTHTHTHHIHIQHTHTHISYYWGPPNTTTSMGSPLSTASTAAQSIRQDKQSILITTFTSIQQNCKLFKKKFFANMAGPVPNMSVCPAQLCGPRHGAGGGTAEYNNLFLAGLS